MNLHESTVIEGEEYLLQHDVLSAMTRESQKL